MSFFLTSGIKFDLKGEWRFAVIKQNFEHFEHFEHKQVFRDVMS